jgi:hypothetical protein
MGWVWHGRKVQQKLQQNGRVRYFSRNAPVMRQAVANGVTADLRSLFDLMKIESKNRYRMFKKRTKNGVFFVQDNQTRKQSSLRTGDKTEATRLSNALNQAHRQPHLNLQIARSYLLKSLNRSARPPTST